MRRGYTLMVLLVVIAIVATTAAFANGSRGQGRGGGQGWSGGGHSGGHGGGYGWRGRYPVKWTLMSILWDNNCQGGQSVRTNQKRNTGRSFT